MFDSAEVLRLGVVLKRLGVLIAMLEASWCLTPPGVRSEYDRGVWRVGEDDDTEVSFQHIFGLGEHVHLANNRNSALISYVDSSYLEAGNVAGNSLTS